MVAGDGAADPTPRLRRLVSVDCDEEDPVPAAGEILVDAATGIAKVGDGVAPWSALPRLHERLSVGEGAAALEVRQDGDAEARARLRSDGALAFGDGSQAPDLVFGRYTAGVAGVFAVNDGALQLAPLLAADPWREWHVATKGSVEGLVQSHVSDPVAHRAAHVAYDGAAGGADVAEALDRLTEGKVSVVALEEHLARLTDELRALGAQVAGQVAQTTTQLRWSDGLPSGLRREETIDFVTGEVPGRWWADTDDPGAAVEVLDAGPDGTPGICRLRAAPEGGGAVSWRGVPVGGPASPDRSGGPVDGPVVDGAADPPVAQPAAEAGAVVRVAWRLRIDAGTPEAPPQLLVGVGDGRWPGDGMTGWALVAGAARDLRVVVGDGTQLVEAGTGVAPGRLTDRWCWIVCEADVAAGEVRVAVDGERVATVPTAVPPCSALAPVVLLRAPVAGPGRPETSGSAAPGVPGPPGQRCAVEIDLVATAVDEGRGVG